MLPERRAIKFLLAVGIISYMRISYSLGIEQGTEEIRHQAVKIIRGKGVIVSTSKNIISQMNRTECGKCSRVP